MERICLIGGAGLIGSRLARQLLESGHDVMIVDSLMALSEATEQTRPLAQASLARLRTLPVPFVELDVRSTDRLVTTVSQFRATIVIWLAALLASQSRADPALAVDVQVNALDAFLRELPADVRRLVLASSSYVYGNFRASTADEDHPRRPIDVYGRTKLMAEELSWVWSFARGFEVCIVRPSAVFGCGDSRPRFPVVAVESALRDGVVTVVDGDFLSDFTYVEDAAQGFCVVAMSAPAGTVANVAAGVAVTEEGFGRSVCEATSARLVLGPSTWRATGYVPARGAMDISRARSLGFAPEFDVRTGVAALLDERERLLSGQRRG